jgi:arylsulfate sulfotransferase
MIKMLKYLPGLLKFFAAIVLFGSCTNNGGNIIEEIKIGEHGNNVLKIQIDVATIAKAEVYVEYWRDSNSNQKILSPVSPKGLSHKIVLTNIDAQTNYSFDVVTIQEGIKKISKKYNFKSKPLPGWLQNQFKYSCNQPEVLPQIFKEGFMLLNKRETPGVAYIVDYKGNLKWYHTVDGTGFKVTHFTKDTSIISILGRNDEPTSYGSEILEINLLGDTLMHLKKGQGDFKYTIHHEKQIKMKLLPFLLMPESWTLPQ